MTPPFRVGTTSYILPADILPNVEHLASRVDDIEVLLFEVDDGLNNLPAPSVVEELSRIAKEANLSYTIHTPSDLELGGSSMQKEASIEKVRRVVDCVGSLQPWAYVVHLNGAIERAGRGCWSDWAKRCVESLDELAAIVGGPERIVVENLERYPLGVLEPVFESSSVARCVDIGHLWVDGQDPVEYLLNAIARTRVIHLHGLADRDHRSLSHMAPDVLDPVVRVLVRQGYSGVVTLEVFSEEDFEGSMSALEASLSRLEK